MISFLSLEEQHQHSNGGGWVANTTTVEASAYIGVGAWVSGNAQVFGNARVFGNAQVFGDARVSDNARVYGDAWEESPLYIQGTKHSITNCAYGQIAIGCQVHTFAEWKAKYKAIGKAAGYTAAQVKEYGLLIAVVTKLGKKAIK